LLFWRCSPECYYAGHFDGARIERAEGDLRRSGVIVAGFLSIPIGTYDRQSALNLGQNRWQHDLQVDFTQTLFEKFTIDVSGVWT
jgi:hypothetical protein